MDKSERRARFNRQNILETAKILFLDKGVNKTTMDEIASKADYSKSTVYVYFKSKEDIYYHIVLEYMNLLKFGIGDCMTKDEDVEGCYYSICNTLVEFEKNYPIYFDCVLGKISVEEKEYEKLPVLAKIYQVGEEINTLVVNFLEKAIKTGYLDSNIQPLPTVFVLWASICSLISVSSTKEQYFHRSLGMNRQEFLRYGFGVLLNSIRRTM